MSGQDAPPEVKCSACQHIDFAHADVRGCAFGGCGCERVNFGYGWLAPDEVPVRLSPFVMQERMLALATELEAEAQDWSNDPAAMGAKANAAARIREALR